MRVFVTLLSIVAIGMFWLSNVGAGNTIGNILSAIWLIAWLLWLVRCLKP